MQLVLYRTYYPIAVNGELFINEERQCYTIELPWLNNQPQRSCIPEGTYVLQKRWSPRLKWHLQVKDVKDRSFILIHPANNAQKELKGCIAPATQLLDIGIGAASRLAFEKLKSKLFAAMKTETVFLTIKNKNYEHRKQNEITYTQVL